MKKGYKKLLIFEIILIIVLSLNSFVSSILKAYSLPVFLALALLIFYFIFGFEKDRHRYTKDILMEIFITIMICLIIYYLLGIVVGFARIQNYYTVKSFINIILPLILTILLKEIFRYMLLQKSEGSIFLFINSILFFILIDIINPLTYLIVKSKYDIFLFIALTLLPTISNNISCTYISKKVGYKPVIFFQLVMILHRYLLPIVPDLNEYLMSIFLLVIPFIVAYRVYLFFELDKDKDVEREKPKENKLLIVTSMVFIIIIIYFTSGYFKYYAIAIASGSMEPVIKKGDIAIIEKVNDKYDELQVGQIIAYKYHEIVVVHRIIDIAKYDDKHRYFYTKGDANLSADNYPIKEEMIIGKVNLKVPIIGYPTVWLNEL